MITPIIKEDARAIVQDLGAILSPLSGRSILIAGAGGFLGSYFCDVIMAFNEAHGALPAAHVTAIDNFKVGLPSRLSHLKDNRNITLMAHSVTQPLTLDRVPDYIIHLASIGSPVIYRHYPLETIATNVDGTRNLLELARRGTRSMLYFSSSEVYGDPAPSAIPTNEDYRGYVSFTGPRACYDESKRLGETLCVSYWHQYGVPVKSIRPFNVFGPGQRIDDGRIVPDLMKAALAGGPLVLHSDGKATRSFCYAADFVRGCLMVLMSNENGEAFNVGNDQEISIGELARTMASVVDDVDLKIEYKASDDADYLVDNPNRRCPDLGKMQACFGFEPKVGLREGLKRTLTSYRQEKSCSA